VIIYLAGNTPDREREEKVLVKKKLSKKRLISFFFLLTDSSMQKLFRFWIRINKK